MFELFGSIVALAMYNRTDSKVLYLEMPLAPVIFKLLLGGKPTMDDFAVWQPEMAKSFQFILDYDGEEPLEDIVDSYFVAETMSQGMTF